MHVKPFVVAVEPDHLASLDDVVDCHRDAERAWLKQAREDCGLQGLRGPDATEARQRIRLRQAHLREVGTLRGTRDLVIAHEARQVLRSWKLDGPFDPVPPKDAGARGRPAGSASSRYPRTPDGQSALSGRLAVRLPSDLADQILRSTYWHSAPAVEELREWQRKWGDGPVVVMREATRSGAPADLAGLLAAMTPRATADAIAQRMQLQEQIITSGDVLRESLTRAISND
ncbi:hypothetical protein [Streptomyces sp. NPDC087272]|uniref:hypothetical protein n=1 Tax=Streptomyces sp. NPDC087272 TaxID=3365775 RepID=UPI00380DD750